MCIPNGRSCFVKRSCSREIENSNCFRCGGEWREQGPPLCLVVGVESGGGGMSLTPPVTSPKTTRSASHLRLRSLRPCPVDDGQAMP